jgi:hypothetical protein
LPLNSRLFQADGAWDTSSSSGSSELHLSRSPSASARGSARPSSGTASLCQTSKRFSTPPDS